MSSVYVREERREASKLFMCIPRTLKFHGQYPLEQSYVVFEQLYGQFFSFFSIIVFYNKCYLSNLYMVKSIHPCPFLNYMDSFLQFRGHGEVGFGRNNEILRSSMRKCSWVFVISNKFPLFPMLPLSKQRAHGDIKLFGD